MRAKCGSGYGITRKETMRMAELAGMDPAMTADEATSADACENDDVAVGWKYESLPAEIAKAALSLDGDGFARYVHENWQRIRAAAWQIPEVAEILVLGYRVGVSNGSGACMNDLGALYYMGDIVDQDYAKAAELYEMAVDAGCYQSIINLGYIYEYGRTGDPDHSKAYQWYALAAALAPSSEAVYKLGDMYSRGKAVPRDMGKAYLLYERSLRLACTDAEIAQPAIRLAKMLIDPQGPSYGVPNDAMRALALYQQAEIGLRKDIAEGQTYYAKRLREAIEGQSRARELVDAPTMYV